VQFTVRCHAATETESMRFRRTRTVGENAAPAGQPQCSVQRTCCTEHTDVRAGTAASERRCRALVFMKPLVFVVLADERSGPTRGNGSVGQRVAAWHTSGVHSSQRLLQTRVRRVCAQRLAPAPNFGKASHSFSGLKQQTQLCLNQERNASQRPSQATTWERALREQRRRRRRRRPPNALPLSRALVGTVSDRVWTWIVTVLDLSRYSFQQLVRAMIRFTKRMIRRNMDLHSGSELEIVVEILGIQEEPYIDPLDDWKLTKRVWYQLPGGQRAYLPSLHASTADAEDGYQYHEAEQVPGDGQDASTQGPDPSALEDAQVPRPACE
jgi:hypothetical protein